MTDRDDLLAIIRDARYYVSEHYLQSMDEQTAQEALLQRMDAVLPKPPPPAPFECCDGDCCCLPKGHDGDCSEIPF